MNIIVYGFKSSNILNFFYQSDEKKLSIMFVGGREYIYSDVPLDAVLRFISAESKGKFFANNIKGSFKFEKGSE